MLANIGTLLMLIVLQAVLGFDNLLYISLESKKAPEDKQSYVRKIGIGLAIFLRLGLLFLLTYLIQFLQTTYDLSLGSFISGSFSIHSFIVWGGGVFILYTAMKEIWHMIQLDDAHANENNKEKVSVNKIITWIVVMNLVFSFDSILSAMALTDVLWVMAAAIVISGVLMIWLADHVSSFLKKNRLYEVLGLFILFIVGIMLILEGAHKAKVQILGNEIHEMSKTTFYFVITILVLIDIVQGRYQKKLLQRKNKEH